MAVAKRVGDVTWSYLPVLVNIKQKQVDFVEKIMPTVRPSWKKDEVVPKVINTGQGYSNDLIGFRRNSDDEDVVLLRVNGIGVEHFVNREREAYIKCLLHHANLGPPVYCKFNNGLCYGYVPGRTVTLEQLKDPLILQKIAKSMALLHSYQLPNQLCNKETIPIASFDVAYQMMGDDIEQSTRFKKAFISKENLQREISHMKYIAANLVSPIVLCHNDLQCGNIILGSDGSVSFIDIEYAGLNHSACEIGNFFGEFAGVDSPNYSLYPDEMEQKRFIKYYLEEVSQLKGLASKTNITDEDVHKFYTECNQGAAVMHLLWVVWSIVQSRFHDSDPSDNSFDYIKYGITRYGHYQLLKGKFVP